MMASEVLDIVQQEIGDDWAISNAHGVDLRTSLLRVPLKRSFEHSTRNATEMVDLWVVLEERPDSSGYQIVFDEDAGRFGLATAGLFLGLYGTFLATLEAM